MSAWPRACATLLLCIAAVTTSAQTGPTRAEPVAPDVRSDGKPEATAPAKTDPWGPLLSQAVICPPVPDPRPSAAEIQTQAHWRAETGTTCWWTGQCLLPNSRVC